MTRAVSVGRSSHKGLFAKFTLGALGSVLVTMTLSGCPGTLQGDFPAPPGGGSAGSSGGTAGAGTAGATGTAGTSGGNGYPGCDITPLITKYGCTAVGICHDASGSGANFDMATSGWQNMLVGVKPKGGGTVPSMCGASTNPYIIKGSATGDGLFLQKLKPSPPCGIQMPYTGQPSYPTTPDLTCFQQFTTALANQ
ncbi:MAG TPA: hypothetical protein VK989_20615 [Polyangia bacterium]|jgi:hypothetical protein|nr:hypothetical protein [Polyangia bacterium]